MEIKKNNKTKQNGSDLLQAQHSYPLTWNDFQWRWRVGAGGKNCHFLNFTKIKTNLLKLREN